MHKLATVVEDSQGDVSDVLKRKKTMQKLQLILPDISNTTRASMPRATDRVSNWFIVTLKRSCEHFETR